MCVKGVAQIIEHMWEKQQLNVWYDWVRMNNYFRYQLASSIYFSDTILSNDYRLTLRPLLGTEQPILTIAKFLMSIPTVS